MEPESFIKALQTQNIGQLKRLIREARDSALEDFRAGRIDGRALTRRLSGLTDQQVNLIADHHLTPFKDKVALVFTGGNGRGETHPYSDLDLLTLVPDELPEGFEEAYSNFYLTFIDAGFIKPGLAVRSPAECPEKAQEDPTIWTALLDRRYTWGSKDLFTAMNETMNALRSHEGDKLFAQSLAQRGTRLGKMADSRYMLHPNVKEGRGGLRDHQTVLWIAQAAFGCHDMACFVEQGLLSAEEKQRIEEAHDFLLTVRCHLHDIHGKPGEQITAELLPDLVDRYNQSRPGQAPETIESFMREYFRHSREIGFFADIIGDALENKSRWFAPTRTVEDKFEITDNHIRFRGTIEDPVDMIAIFLAAGRNDCTLDHSALRAIRANAGRIDETVRANPEASRIFIEILTSGEKAAGFLRQMQETGMLQQFIPPFAHIDRLMQFDPYHEYTVDEHSFRCLQEMYGLQCGDHGTDAPLATRLFAQASDKDRAILYTAMLLHDSGKGHGGRHEIIGARYAQELCPRLGFDKEQTELVTWLAEHHLLLSQTAFHYDCFDPVTIENFCASVPSEKHLDLLTILTTADIMGVGPGRWNWNKAAHISLLHENAKYFLAEKSLRETPQTELPADYRPGETRIEVQNDPDRQVTVVTVITPDQSSLFEKLTGALSTMGGNILDARIETAPGNPPIAIDRFTLHDSGGKAYLEYDFDRIRSKVGEALAPDSNIDIDGKLGAISKRQKFRIYSVQPVIQFNNAASRDSTVLELEARDCPELLYHLSRTFNEMGLDLRRAKIALYGHKAADTFYLRDRATGTKIDPARFEEISKAIAATPALNAG